jgi:hypothetical protein
VPSLEGWLDTPGDEPGRKEPDMAATLEAVTDRVLEEMAAWRSRPPAEDSAAIFIDAIMAKICTSVPRAAGADGQQHVGPESGTGCS